MRRPLRSKRESLRAGMPVAVVAEIRSGVRIVGTVALHAVRNGIVADGSRGHFGRAVVIIPVVVITRGVAGIAVIAAAACGDRAADHGACHGARDEAATAAAAMAIVTATAAAMTIIPAATAAAAAELRAGTTCHARARTRAGHLRRCAATAPEPAATHLRSSSAHAGGSASAAGL